MPELPEVESIKLQLQKFIVGHKIIDFELRIKKYREWDKRQLLGAIIVAIRRFGKVLVIDLSNGFSIVTHVKMTGQFIYRGPNLTKKISISRKVVGGIGGKHTHVIFKLDRGGKLYFNDYRKFGWMKIIKSSQLKAESEFLASLGPEFLKEMTLDKFKEILSKSKKPIKILLMEQNIMAGVGNIYANDALWLAKINPNRKARELNKTEIKKLFDSVETVLKEGIKRGGASELAFVTPDGNEGNYQDFRLVYGREKEPCRVCKTPIKKIKLGGRGTYYCLNCQK